MNSITIPPIHQPVCCIPVCNEAERIISCLESFAAQDHAGPFDLLLLLNNCSDATEALIRGFHPPPAMRVHVEVRTFAPDLATAGHARKVAMLAARDMARPDAVLLCTDADATVPPDWIRRNLAAIATGADAVAGRAVMMAADFHALPPRLHEDEAKAQLLTELLDRIDWCVDPDPADPWPRHAEHSGASIAVTTAAFDAAGGIPDLPSSEDRAFFVALRAAGARVRHAPDIMVSVSGRLDGRAPGGMAETLRRRLARPDDWLDDCIEPAAGRLWRATLRAALRALHGVPTGGSALPILRQLAAALDLPPAELGRLTSGQPFAAVWHHIEATSPALLPQRVPARAVGAEIGAARAILGDLEARKATAPTARRERARSRRRDGRNSCPAPALVPV